MNPAEMPTGNLPAWMPRHITVNQGGPEFYDLDCTVCHTGMKAGATFGPIDGSTMAATFIVQHAVHRGRTPAGLTPSGDISAAFRHYLQGATNAAGREAG